MRKLAHEVPMHLFTLLYASGKSLLRDRQDQSTSDESVHVRQMYRVYDD